MLSIVSPINSSSSKAGMMTESLISLPLKLYEAFK
jgi:hypothetical protein